MNLAKRFKNERERLGLSQPAIGELVGAGKTTVINWEKGASAPDAVQLAALAAHGADVLYIITGVRSVAVAAEALLAPRKRALLDNYDHLDEEGKRFIESTALFATKQVARKTGT